MPKVHLLKIKTRDVSFTFYLLFTKAVFQRIGSIIGFIIDCTLDFYCFYVSFNRRLLGLPFWGWKSEGII